MIKAQVGQIHSAYGRQTTQQVFDPKLNVSVYIYRVRWRVKKVNYSLEDKPAKQNIDQQHAQRPLIFSQTSCLRRLLRPISDIVSGCLTLVRWQMIRLHCSLRQISS